MPSHARQPRARRSIDRRTPACAGDRDPRRHPDALRRARRGRGADRGHRPGRRASTGRSSTGTSPARRSSSRSPWSATSTSSAAALADAAASTSKAPRTQLAALVSAFVDYGVAHPAFVDCAHSLMRRTGTELFDEISEGAMLRLGRAIAVVPGRAAGARSRPASTAGDFTVDGPRPARQHALRDRPRRAPARPGRARHRRGLPRRTPGRPDRRRAGEGAPAHLGPGHGPRLTAPGRDDAERIGRRRRRKATRSRSRGQSARRRGVSARGSR